MPATYQEQFVVRHREADRNGDLRLAGWFDFLQEAAANHASRLGVGLEMLRNNSMIWVLSRLKLEMERSPRIGERIAVETWPNGFRRLHAARQFRVLGGDGGEIGRASSRWLLLGLPRMRPLKLEALPVELPDNSALPDYFELEEKLPPRALPAELEVPVRYSMEDVNGHMNNAEYAGLVQDFAAAKRGSSPRFRTVELHFLSAVRSPDVLAVGGGFDGDTLFVEGTGRNGVASFTALATF
ncbi:acyl-ACP thioesterase domain-containing protein [uncultured Victivallis sp.]|uniref:acyl-[acyl-carrier-protein] thioesterase n=1 Tax=uncultured Victivallis sp. TaxID=354118 RepID=UPI0025ECA4F9|nr:acyl-ACP thioesterase domain-containing protein [uncultured Victivallis sp.]